MSKGNGAIPIGRKIALIVDIAELDKSNVPVHRVTGRTVKLWREWAQASRDDPAMASELAWNLAGSFVPTLTPEDIDGLTVDSVLRIIQLATMDAEELEALTGKPSAPTPALSASASSTPTPTSSPG